MFTLILIVIIVAVAVAAAIGVAVWSRRRRAKAAAEAKAAEVVIDDIFLIYSDGRLISHHTRKLKPDVDDQVLTSMLTAVQAFIKDSLGADEDGKAVNEIAYGDDRIIIEHGRYVYIAAVVSGRDLKGMHTKMRGTVASIEQELGPALKGWSGDPKELRGAKKWIQLLLG